MVACSEFDRRLTPYLDGLGTAPERSAVEAHLSGCPLCRAVEARERAGRAVLRARAASLVGPSPVGLRTRCGALAAEARRPRFSVGRWLVAPLASAAALVLVAVALVGLTGGSATLVASELTLDHFKCFGLLEAVSGPAEPATLERRLDERYGWNLHVPAGSVPAGLGLVGARKCIYHNGGVAHLMYRSHGRPVSVFMLPGRRAFAGDVAAFGHHSRAWQAGGSTFVLVMRGTDQEVARVAAYFQDQLR